MLVPRRDYCRVNDSAIIALRADAPERHVRNHRAESHVSRSMPSIIEASSRISSGAALERRASFPCLLLRNSTTIPFPTFQDERASERVIVFPVNVN